MALITTFFFLLLVFIISIIPFFLLYGFSDFLRLIMANLVKYRRKVIYNNLVRAFPDKPKNEIEIIQRKAYRNLIDYIVEGIKAFTMRKAQIVKRHKLINPEILEPFIQKKQSIIGLTAHYNNWEWGSLSGSLQTPFKSLALYKPLSNKYIDSILRKSRSRCGTELVSIYETSDMFEKHKNDFCLFLMAADQSPSGRELKNAHWIDFLEVNTPFLHGMEKHAKNNDYPVVFIDIQRKRRGFYELELSILTDKPNSFSEGKLTELYAQKLESIIKKEPSNWLWSHKRWKHC